MRRGWSLRSRRGGSTPPHAGSRNAGASSAVDTHHLGRIGRTARNELLLVHPACLTGELSRSFAALQRALRAAIFAAFRSEERRVGKECSSRERPAPEQR